mmetsp:Transcript_112316/g.312544  ORF Transcript_112316/g.312544 Transcript_112316/m.312544 type:complete len:499 (-) Transcript_112316:81-1577(-)
MIASSCEVLRLNSTEPASAAVDSSMPKSAISAASSEAVPSGAETWLPEFGCAGLLPPEVRLLAPPRLARPAQCCSQLAPKAVASSTSPPATAESRHPPRRCRSSSTAARSSAAASRVQPAQSSPRVGVPARKRRISSAAARSSAVASSAAARTASRTSAMTESLMRASSARLAAAVPTSLAKAPGSACVAPDTGGTSSMFSAAASVRCVVTSPEALRTLAACGRRVDADASAVFPCFTAASAASARRRAASAAALRPPMAARRSSRSRATDRVPPAAASASSSRGVCATATMGDWAPVLARGPARAFLGLPPLPGAKSAGLHQSARYIAGSAKPSSASSPLAAPSPAAAQSEKWAAAAAPRPPTAPMTLAGLSGRRCSGPDAVPCGTQREPRTVTPAALLRRRCCGVAVSSGWGKCATGLAGGEALGLEGHSGSSPAVAVGDAVAPAATPRLPGRGVRSPPRSSSSTAPPRGRCCWGPPGASPRRPITAPPPWPPVAG